MSKTDLISSEKIDKAIYLIRREKVKGQSLIDAANAIKTKFGC